MTSTEIKSLSVDPTRSDSADCIHEELIDMNIDTDYPEEHERRAGPERLLDDTTANINFAIVRRRSFTRGYWLGYAGASACALIWVVLDLYATGRLLGMGG